MSFPLVNSDPELSAFGAKRRAKTIWSWMVHQSDRAGGRAGKNQRGGILVVGSEQKQEDLGLKHRQQIWRVCCQHPLNRMRWV